MKKTLVILGLTLALATNYAVAKPVATVNGMDITVEEVNNALYSMTQGKMSWDQLPDEGKKQLIERMAVAKLIAAESKKSLNDKEKEAALSAYWMQKKMSTTEVTDKEAEDAYNKMKKAAKEAKSKQEIPAFEMVKNSIKMQLAQEKVVSSVMKNAKIKVK